MKNNPRANQLRVGSHSGSAIHSAAPPYRPPYPSFSLLDRARPVCLRPKSRRFAAVGLRHAPAGAVSFSSGRKNWGPRRNVSVAVAVGRGGRNGAERSPRRQAGTEWAEFLPTTWGGALHQPSLVSIPPRPKGEYQPITNRAPDSPPAQVYNPHWCGKTSPAR